MEGGFIRLSRSFFEHSYWMQKRSFSHAEAWLDLIQLARYEEKPADKLLANGREITVERGEVHASLRYLAERWGWGLEKTKKFFDKHIKSGKVERRTEQGESLIKLCRYDFYNPTPNSSRYTEQHSRKNSSRTTTDTNSKKDKEGKERKERKEAPLPSPKGDVLREMFDEFRKAYKGTTRGLDTELADFQKKHSDWQKVIPQLLPALQREVEHREEQAAYSLFVPSWKHLKTWLANRCWEQEFHSKPLIADSIPQPLEITI